MKLLKCKICFKNIREGNFKSIFFPSLICDNCLKEMKPIFKYFKVDNKYNALAIYEYNDKIRKMLYDLKGVYDYELAKCFLDPYFQLLELKYSGFAVIFAPSYYEDDQIRGFNHVEEIFNFPHLKQLKILHKTSPIRQVDVKGTERAEVGKYLTIDDIDLSGKKVLIVDDVFTTGSTIRSCIKLVETKNPKLIKVLIMAIRQRNE